VIKKNYVTFDINLAKAKQLGLSKDEINKIQTFYKSLNYDSVKKIEDKKENPIDYDLVSLRGKQGESAYKDPNLMTLIIKLPLSLLAEEQRRWLSIASNFFKPHFFCDSETITPGQDFSRIIDGQFSTFEYETYDPKNPKKRKYFIRRVRRFSDPAPYASKTTRKQDIEQYYKYVWELYQQLKKEKTPRQNLKYFARYATIAKKVTGKRFGNLIIKNPPEELTIRNILYFWSKKISS